MNKMKAYVKLVVAQLVGDPSEVVAQKNYLKANSAVNAQIAALDGNLVDANSEVEAAEEALIKAKYPTIEISDRKQYAQNIVNASKKLEEKKEVVADIKESIEFFKALSVEFNEEVA